MRRFPLRTFPLIALLLTGALVAACSDDSGSKQTKSKSTTATTTASSPATTAANDPASCIRGTFRFTRMDYDGPVQTQFGPTTISGGIGGRRIELKPDNTFHFTDDGSDKVQFSVPSQGGTASGTAVLKAQSDGTFVPSGQTANFNITALSGTLVLTFTNGSMVNIPLPPDGAGVKETFGLNGDANYTCQGNTITFRFPALTIVVERV
jgi:cytoskeletal protein RodZ